LERESLPPLVKGITAGTVKYRKRAKGVTPQEKFGKFFVPSSPASEKGLITEKLTGKKSQKSQIFLVEAKKRRGEPPLLWARIF